MYVTCICKCIENVHVHTCTTFIYLFIVYNYTVFYVFDTQKVYFTCNTHAYNTQGLRR
jgi:hypothetical protein